jgi:hypothetical protein
MIGETKKIYKEVSDGNHLEDNYIVKVHSAGQLVEMFSTMIDVLPKGIK